MHIWESWLNRVFITRESGLTSYTNTGESTRLDSKNKTKITNAQYTGESFWTPGGQFINLKKKHAKITFAGKIVLKMQSGLPNDQMIQVSHLEKCPRLRNSIDSPWVSTAVSRLRIRTTSSIHKIIHLRFKGICQSQERLFDNKKNRGKNLATSL